LGSGPHLTITIKLEKKGTEGSIVSRIYRSGGELSLIRGQDHLSLGGYFIMGANFTKKVGQKEVGHGVEKKRWVA